MALSDFAAGVQDAAAAHRQEQREMQKLIAERIQRDLENEYRSQQLGLQERSLSSLDAARQAEAERDRAAAERERARTKGFETFVNDPMLPPATRQLIRAGQYGIGNVGRHDFEPAPEHEAHVRAEDARKRNDAFEDFRRRRDYEVSHPFPTSSERTRGADLPDLPRGTQAYIFELPTKYPGDYRRAQEDLNNRLREWMAGGVHPNISPQRAHRALREAFGLPAGTSDDGMDIDLEGLLGGGGGGDASLGRPVGGGGPRIVMPSPSPRGATAPGGALRVPASRLMTRIELRAVAERLGITEAEAEAQAQARGMMVR